MGTVGRIVIGLETQSDAFTKGAKTVQKDLDGIGNSARKNSEHVSGLRGQLEKLKGEAGRGSTLDELGKTLKGAGAVMGISLIGEALEGATKKAKELSDEYHKGQLDATGFGVKIGESVPIFGKFVEAGQNIREMFTHEQEQIDHINESIKTGNELMEARVKTAQDVKKANDEILEGIRKANQELALANAKTPQDKEKVEKANKLDDAKHEYAVSLQEKDKMRQDDLKKELEAIRKDGEARKAMLEDDAHNALSFYNKHSYNDGAEKAAEDAKRLADAQADSITNTQLKAAQARAKNDVAEFQKGMDQEQSIKKAALEKEEANDVAKRRAKEATEIMKEGAERVKSFLNEVAKVGEAVNKAGEKTKHEAYEKEMKHIEDMKKDLDDLKKEAAQFGMTESQKKLDDLKRGGADDATVAQAKGIQDQIDKMQKWKDEQKEANDLIKESMSPLDKYQEKLAKVNKLYDDGLISQQQAKDAIKKAIKEDDKEDKGDDKKVAAQTRRFDFRGPAQEPEKQDKAAQQLQVALQDLEIQKQIAFYQQQLYQFGLSDQTDTNDQIDFLA